MSARAGVGPRPTLSFSDVRVGDPLPELRKGPMSTMHIMRWSAAIENWHRIHYDQAFARDHEKLPDVLVNGSWKQHVLCQLLKDWVGPAGWVSRIRFEYRAMDLSGDTIVAFGSVRDKRVRDGRGWIECDIGLRNQRGIESTRGEGTVTVPLDRRPRSEEGRT